MTRVVSRGKVKPRYYVILLAFISLIYMLFSCGSATESETSSIAPQNIPPPGGPVIRYTSAEAGPNRGWEGSTTRGAAITIWAIGIGSTRGNSYVTVGSVDLESDPDYAEWGSNTNPETAKDFRRITFWLNSQMPEGDTEIYITVNGVKSNSLPFRIDNSGGIYFLSLDGDDNNDGKCATNKSGCGPWKNFGKTADKVGPGDFVYMRGGVYTDINESSATKKYEYIGTLWGTEPPINGTDALRILVTSYPGEMAVFKNVGIRIHNSDYWTFANLKWDGADDRVPLSMGAERSFCEENNDHSVGLSAIGIEFTGNIYHAIHSYGDDFRIVANNFNNLNPNYDTKGYTGYILYLSSGKNMIVKDNEFSGGSMYAIHAYDEDRPSCTDLGRGMENWTIEGNWINASDVGQGYRSAIIVGVSKGGIPAYVKNITIKNNIMYTDGTATGGGVRIFGGDEKGIRIYNNTFYGFPAGVEIDYGSNDNVDNVSIKNNIFANISGVHIDNNRTNPFNLEVSNNLYDKTPSFDKATDESPITGDPLFVGVSNLDFHLQPGSPAIDAGIFLPDVPSDYDGSSRPIDGDGDGTATYDVGVYEVVK